MKHYTWTILFVLVSACSPVEVGGDGGGGKDAETGGDGGAGGGDAAQGMVTARVLDPMLAPVAGAKVAFSKADGTLISVQTTDANGEASETMDAGGMVSAGTVIPSSDVVQYQVMTVMGAVPGDVIEFGPRSKAPTYDSLGSANFRFGTDWNADHYEVGTDCNNTSLPAPQAAGTVYTYNFQDDRCSHRMNHYDALAYALGDANGTNVKAWCVFPNMYANDPNTHYPDPWSTDFTQLDAYMSNVPFTGNVNLSAQMIHSNVVYGARGFLRQVGVTGGQTADYMIPLPQGFSERNLISFNAKSPAGDHFLGYAEMVGASDTTLAVDTGTLGYPMFNNVSVNASMPDRPAVRFTADGAIPDSAEASLAFAFWIDPNGAAQESWQWIVIGPPGTPSPMRAPALPNDFLTDPSGANPRWPPPASYSIGALVAGALELGDLNGWDEVRTKRGISVVGDDSFLGSDAPVGAKSIISAGGMLPN